MKKESEENNKKEKKEEKEGKGLEEEDLKFHDKFSEVKDAIPLFKSSNLEQFVSQESRGVETNRDDKEKSENKDQVKYSQADYTSRNTEWSERDLVADIDDLKRVGILLDKNQRVQFRQDFSLDRPRVEMPTSAEMRNDRDGEIVKYADKRRDVWQDEFGAIHRRELKKYRREI